MKKIILSLITLSSIVAANAQDKKELNVKYRRSSLYTLMVENPAIPHADVIKSAFVKGPIPEKFNDHISGSRTIPTNNEEDQTTNIKNYLETNNVAKELVAKWFNRSASGAFNMDLIKSRGSYDASVVDIATAKASKRGLEMLADAGEELIKNTFVLVNDYKYVSKEEVAKKASGLLRSVGSIASVVPGGGNLSTTTELAATGVTVAGKGYVVKTTAHLYRLEWNDEVAATFYNDYWADDKTITQEKKKAFDDSNIFKLTYVGSDVSWADVQSTIFTKKTDDELIERATIKAVDAVIVELQKNHDDFKTKTPLFTGEPITAKIGVKEGVTNKSKFDVLEQQIDENGKTKYVVVGSIKVDEDFPIWDNRYGAEEENPDNKTDRTHFKKVSGKEFYPGMLIIQKKGK
ncbi:hypothetical protein EQG63_01345 [Flavobacterium amnicola]|uniref:Uncharacterized protein n=1 Tax=Flavobacterium amnicola TaxID=2506422 RepID=A0A4Q1K446_9FLAO|nr:hypothetical protein [Flavobacterium amnicola]RXR20606.1 hypothetical protein EQG63_01345 [Flavobacterium amnicola]